MSFVVNICVGRVILVRSPVSFAVHVPVQGDGDVSHRAFRGYESTIPPPVCRFVLLVFVDVYVVARGVGGR